MESSQNSTATNSTTISTTTTTEKSRTGSLDEYENQGIKFKDWGFNIDRLFEVAYRFYKRNESKAFHPSFDVRNKMNALILQARHGNYDEGKTPDPGAFDLVGKSRRSEWLLLKGMSKSEAMSKFICTLDEICPMFKAYAEAVKISIDSQQTDPWKKENGTVNNNEISHSDDQLKAIHTSLCRQTYSQFKTYAEKQYPNDSPKQKYLISTLQEQYYQQYISQMHPELANNQNNNSTKGNSNNNNNLHNINVQPPPVNQPPADPISPKVEKEPEKLLDLMNNISKDSSSRESSLTGEGTTLSSSNIISTISEISIPKQIEQDNYQSSIKPKSIGKFESYPEPKPILNPTNQVSSSAASFVINLFNPDSNRKDQPASIQQTPSQAPPPTMLNTAHVTSNVAPTQSQAFSDSQPESKKEEIVELPPTSSNGNSLLGNSPQDTLQSNINGSINEHQQMSETVTCEHQKPIVDSWSCDSSSSEGSPLQHSVTYEPLEPASIWTKKGVHEFKESLIDDKHGGTYVVKQGTLLTIQVPTYPDGRYIYWEFVTEDYDIGFGLDFVYETNLEKPLALKIYEETDEDDDEYDETELVNEENRYDLESGLISSSDKSTTTNMSESTLRKRAEKFARATNTISIVPTYRRDSHEEVFVGRHRYPASGYYLLKFDNTYSVLRSKTIFFRVCYLM